MPRYFFDVDDGVPTFDRLGAEFKDLEAAHLEALRLSGALIKDEPDRFRGVRCWGIEIRTEADGVLRRVTLLTTHQSFSGLPVTVPPTGTVQAEEAGARSPD